MTAADGNRCATVDILRSAPRVLFSILLDLKTLIFWWCYLRLRLMRATPVCRHQARRAGDRISDSQSREHGIERRSNQPHSRFPIRPQGHRKNLPRLQRHCLGAGCFRNRDRRPRQAALTSSGKPPCFPTTLVLPGECKDISDPALPAAFYQRHCRFAIAGALLSRRLKVPLILEYNGPEGWIADHWDPTPLRSWIRLCEEVTLRCATRIIVVSEVLTGGLGRERYSGRSHSGQSECCGSGLFLSWTRERRRTQGA